MKPDGYLAQRGRFGREFWGWGIGFALGLFRDVGTTRCLWRPGFLRTEKHGGPVGVPHGELGPSGIGRGVVKQINHRMFEKDGK
jgi:hypothetical protein